MTSSNPIDNSNARQQEQGDHVPPANEQTSSAVNGNPRAELKQSEKKVSYLDLPKKGQLAVLCIARLADPLANTSIQAYLFYQLKFFNPTASDAMISTQAGMIVSARQIAMVASGMLWGRLADSEWGGRKAVLLIGLVSNGISFTGYGLSRSLISATAWQVFGGLMSNNVAIVRCVVAELNPEKRYRTRALLLLPLFASAGQLLGPLVGGLLSPNKGDRSGTLYPYAPPNILIAAISFIAAVGVLFGLEETLESLQGNEESKLQKLWRLLVRYISKKKAKNYNYTSLATEEPDSPDSPIVELSPTTRFAPSLPKPPKPKRKLPFRRIWTFNVVCTMLSHFIIAGQLGTFNNLWAIYLSTPIAAFGQQHLPFRFTGGLGMLPRDVGFVMSIFSAASLVLQLAIYPTLNDRFGTIKIWRAALFVLPVVYILAPYPSLVASASSLGHRTALVWLAMGFVALLSTIGRTGITPATTLLINDCTPHPSARGTIHSAGAVIGHLGRSVFPIAALAIFGEGLRVGVVGLGFWCLACLAVLALVASHWVREGSNGNEIVLEDEEETESERVAATETGVRVR